MTTTKLRILCLHGFTSNGAVHAHQLRRLVAMLYVQEYNFCFETGGHISPQTREQTYLAHQAPVHLTSGISIFHSADLNSPEYTFLFPSAPHPVDIATQSDLSNPSEKAWSDFVTSLSPSIGHRAWWFARDDPSSTKSQPVGSLQGLETSLSFLKEYIATHGPIHSIWGFSQGACLAGILSSLLHLPSHPLHAYLSSSASQNPSLPLSSGIFFSGFRARFPQYDSLYEAPAGIPIPTMHVMGERDSIVERERSEGLVAVCEERGRSVLRHEGGHDIPKGEGELRRIVDFVRGCSSMEGGGEEGSKQVQASM